jgi:16S rRNA G966 N2-methylase RsmD
VGVPRGRLQPHQVIALRNDVRAGMPRSIAARKYGLSRSGVDYTLKSTAWLSLPTGSFNRQFPDPDLLSIDFRRQSRPDRNSAAERRLADRVFSAYRVYGYPYRTWQPQHFDRFLAHVQGGKASLTDGIITGGPAGLRLVNAFHPELEHVNRKDTVSPADTFADDRLFRQTIYIQIRHGRRLTPSGIRSALSETGASSQISTFRPTIALKLIEHFGARSVLDPCAGWGGRMVGAIAADARYVGIDPHTAAVAGNNRFLETFRALTGGRPQVTLITGCAEDVLPTLSRQVFDLILTSPPYFDLERYTNEPTQSALRHPTLELWNERFLRVMLDRAAALLRPQGVLAINTSIELQPLVLANATLLGLQNVGVIDIRFETRRWQRAEGKYTRLEPITLIRRP